MAMTHGCISSYTDRYIYPPFLIQAILSLLTCKILYYVLRPYIRSRVFCNVLAGIILGPMVLGQNKAYMELVFPNNEILVLDTMVRIGAGFLVFLKAVRFDTTRFPEMAKTIWVVSIPGVVASTLFFYHFLKKLQMRNTGFIVKNARLFALSETFSVASFTTVSEAMAEHNLSTTELGLLSMSSAMINEVMCWILIIIGVLFHQKTTWALIQVIISMCTLLIFVFYVVRPTMFRIIRTTPEGRSMDETILITIVICAMVMGTYTDYMVGIFPLGTFLIGLAIPNGRPICNAIVEKYELMINEFFQPLAFLFIGFHIDLSFALKNPKDFIMFIALVFGGHLAKILGILLGSLLTKINFRDIFLLGFISNMKGIIELLLYRRWNRLGEFDKRMYSSVVVSSMFLTLLYDNLLRFLYKPHSRLIESKSKEKYFGALISCLSEKELRILTCIHHEDHVRGIITLLAASNPSSIYVMHTMELSCEPAPYVKPYSRYKGKNKSTHIMKAFFNYSRNTKGLVSIKPFTMVAPYKTMHNLIGYYAEDTKIPLILVPFEENEQDKSIKVFNVQLQENAQSTVGILVDNGLSSKSKLSDILVIFLGGPDDREALSLAMRMSSNQDSRITVLRINLKMDIIGNNDYINNYVQDESLINIFKNYGNRNVAFIEVEVNSSLEMISIIKSLEEDYDLIMMGKMPINKQLKMEMILSTEYQELGLIGDLIFSSDFNCSQAPLLVLQHYRQFDQSNVVLSPVNKG